MHLVNIADSIDVQVWYGDFVGIFSAYTYPPFLNVLAMGKDHCGSALNIHNIKYTACKNTITGHDNVDTNLENKKDGTLKNKCIRPRRKNKLT